MLEKIIHASIKNRFLVFVFTAVLVGFGIDALRKLPIDAVPDITNVQVQVLTSSPGLGPVEAEKFVTFPVESSMSGLPDVAELRSVSRSGLSVVTIVFDEHVNAYFARQLVGERLVAARELIPEGCDLHVWTLTSGVNAVSVHVVLADGADHDGVRCAVQSAVSSPFGIAHVTVQAERGHCDDKGAHA